jgi:hypothetical protein
MYSHVVGVNYVPWQLSSSHSVCDVRHSRELQPGEVIVSMLYTVLLDEVLVTANSEICTLQMFEDKL